MITFRSLYRLAAVALLALTAPSLRAATYDYSVIGDPTLPTPAPTSPGWMLMGGSDDVDEAFRWLIRKAGGGRIVIIRATEGDTYHDYLYRTLGGVTSVETFVLHEREASEDPRVLDSLRRADGIFIGGGDQGNYVRRWQGTTLNAVLDAHVRAGKPIGGTSAGLAILGSHLYGCLDSISLQSEDALNDPYGPSVTLVRDFLHFSPLDGVITDSHFMKRGRLGRLISWVARLSSEDKRPILGIGVDETTTLCVEGDGSARVFTQRNGQVWLVEATEPAAVLAPGQPLSIDRVSVIALGPDSRFSLKTRQVESPVSRAFARVTAGVLEYPVKK